MFMETRTLTRKIILDAVLTWPEPERMGLIQDIMQGMSTGPDNLPPRKNTADQALGLLRQYTHKSPPTDEEVEKWLEERRIQKYG